jgi:hypothetical protein
MFEGTCSTTADLAGKGRFFDRPGYRRMVKTSAVLVFRLLYRKLRFKTSPAA